PKSETFQEAQDGEHVRRRRKSKRQRRTYVPICLREDEYERQPTPKGFSPDLRRFLFMFFSLNPEERRFNTVRLQEFLLLHPFLEGTNWAALPSPMAQGDAFGKDKTFTPAPIIRIDEEEREQRGGGEASKETEDEEEDPDYYRYEI